MNFLNDYTMKQMVIAAGLARGLIPAEVARIADVSPAYISKCEKNVNFTNIINLFRALPLDKDTKEYRGLGTIYLMVAQVIYNIGEKKLNGTS